MDFKKSRYLMWTGFALGILITLVGTAFENENKVYAFMAVGGVVFFAALIQAFVFYTCPHCGNSLMNVRGDIPQHCPKCGKELKAD